MRVVLETELLQETFPLEQIDNFSTVELLVERRQHTADKEGVEMARFCPLQ